MFRKILFLFLCHFSTFIDGVVQPGQNAYLPPKTGYNYDKPTIPFITRPTTPQKFPFPIRTTIKPKPTSPTFSNIFPSNRPQQPQTDRKKPNYYPNGIPPNPPPITYPNPTTTSYPPINRRPPFPIKPNNQINILRPPITTVRPPIRPTAQTGISTSESRYKEHNSEHHHHHHKPGNPFNFEYSVNDAQYGNDYSHNAASDGDKTTGEYRIKLPDGRTQIVNYVADWATGFHAKIMYQGTPNYPQYKPSSLKTTISKNRPINNYNSNSNNIHQSYVQRGQQYTSNGLYKY